MKVMSSQQMQPSQPKMLRKYFIFYYNQYNAYIDLHNIQ